jgi:histidinol-phosphate aminotransferase
MTFEPSYAMHPLIARVTGMRMVSVKRRAEDFSLDIPAALAAIEAEKPAIVFVTSPNNPTGNATPPEMVAALCAIAPGVVVADEAYREFSSSTSQGLLEERANLIITRTMSKAFALAGVRVGYCLTSAELVEDLHLVRLPYHLSALTQAAAIAALSHAEACLAQVAVLMRERDRVVGALGAMGVEVLPSEANFFCFATPHPPSETWLALLEKGVLVRDVSGWGDLGRFLRACVGTPKENDAFLAAMKEVLDA